MTAHFCAAVGELLVDISIHTAGDVDVPASTPVPRDADLGSEPTPRAMVKGSQRLQHREDRSLGKDVNVAALLICFSLFLASDIDARAEKFHDAVCHGLV